MSGTFLFPFEKIKILYWWDQSGVWQELVQQYSDLPFQYRNNLRGTKGVPNLQR